MKTPTTPTSSDRPDVADFPELSVLSELVELSELAQLSELARSPEPVDSPATSAPAPLTSPSPATATPVSELRDGESSEDELRDDHRDLLAFERRWWRYPGAKEQAIRERFGFSPTRYYQTLNALLDRPAALAYDPSLVNRLRRLRTSRLRARAPR